MITLITGTPGAGKSLITVAKVIPEYAGRPLFVDGIADLQIDHHPADDLEKWHDWLPDNAVLVVDECQRIWRPRPNGAKVPLSVEAMETHRHRGADIVLITQHANLIDQNIRRLVGRHLHVRRVWGLNRALIYEWDQAQTDTGRVSTATKSMWPYPKKAFGLYKSASVHTARGQKPPFLLWLAVALIVAFPFGVYYGYNRIQEKIKPMASVDHVNPGQIQPGSPGHTFKHIPEEPVHPLIAFTPRFPDVPASAPAYDGMLQVAAAPRIEHCIASKIRCICYTQQATRIDISEDKCRRIASGLEFDPYQQDHIPAQEATPQQQQFNQVQPSPSQEPPPLPSGPAPRYEGVVNMT